jgi:uncharacterized protein (DUF697 family)
MTNDTDVLTATDENDKSPTNPLLKLSYRERKALRQDALRVVKKYSLIAGGVGAIPAPFLGQLTVGALLAKMTYDLSTIYQTHWTDHKAKIAVASVLGGAHTSWISHYLIYYATKITPLTTIATLITKPIISAAVVYTIGKLFVRHFESGAWLKEIESI